MSPMAEPEIWQHEFYQSLLANEDMEKGPAKQDDVSTQAPTSTTIHHHAGCACCICLMWASPVTSQFPTNIPDLVYPMSIADVTQTDWAAGMLPSLGFSLAQLPDSMPGISDGSDHAPPANSTTMSNAPDNLFESSRMFAGPLTTTKFDAFELPGEQSSATQMSTCVDPQHLLADYFGLPDPQDGLHLSVQDLFDNQPGLLLATSESVIPPPPPNDSSSVVFDTIAATHTWQHSPEHSSLSNFTPPLTPQNWDTFGIGMTLPPTSISGADAERVTLPTSAPTRKVAMQTAEGNPNASTTKIVKTTRKRKALPSTDEANKKRLTEVAVKSSVLTTTHALEGHIKTEPGSQTHARLSDRGQMDALLRLYRSQGMSFRQIAATGQFGAGVSALRARMATLQQGEPLDRVRRSRWLDSDVQLLEEAVRMLAGVADPKDNKPVSQDMGVDTGSVTDSGNLRDKVKWTEVSKYLADHNASRLYSPAACSKKYDALHRVAV